jgi:rubrerythrin
MTLQEAIHAAMAYETKIRDLYRQAAQATADAIGQHVYGMLAQDEQHHLDYLGRRLRELENAGHLSVEVLPSAIPSPRVLADHLAAIQGRLATEDRKDEKRMLAKALQVEIETSDFYRRMVHEMTDDARRMFARFLEIEDGHIAAVQAQLDYLSGTGYWLDFKEFDMEQL